MARRRTHQIINALALLVGGVCICALGTTLVLFAFPKVAFPFSAGDDRITFYAATPLSQDAAASEASEAWAALQDTPFGQPDHGIDVYVTGGSGWRHWVYFRPAPWAGGLTYPLFMTQTVFLRDVDLEAGRLLGEDGPIPDPRDLTFYLVHEISHLRHSELVGPWAFLRTPRWVTEGLADLAGLGLAEPDLMAAAMAGQELPRDRFGAYPAERACITIVLARPGVEVANLLAIRAPMRSPQGCNTLPPTDSD